MKKLTLLLVIIVLLTTSYYFFSKDENVITESDFLPENTILFCRQTGLDQYLNNFGQSKLGKALNNINYIKAATELQLPPDNIEAIDELIDGYKETIKNPLFKELFGEHFVTALLPVTEGVGQKDLVEETKKSLLIISRPKHSTTILQSLAKVIPGSNVLSRERFKSEEITGYKLDEQNNLYVSVVNQILLLSLSDVPIKQAIERRSSKEKKLTDNIAFNEARQQFLNHSQFTFVQFRSLKETVLGFAYLYFNDEFTLIKKELDALDSYTIASHGLHIDENGSVSSHTKISLNTEEIDPLLQNILLTPSELNQTIDQIPDDLLLYYWLNTVKLADMFEYAVQDNDITPKQVETIKEEVTKVTGITLEELLSLFDTKFSFMMKGSDVQFFLPIPDLGFYVKINDETKFSRVMDKLIKENKIVTHSKVYKEEKLTVWGEVAQNSLQPAYTIYDNYLVVASNERFIKDILDNLSSKRTLKEKTELTQLIDQFYEPNNGMSFIQVDEFIKILKGAVSWGGTIIAIQDREAARQSKIIIDQLIHPVLDGLTMYKNAGYRAYLENDTLNIETVTVAGE